MKSVLEMTDEEVLAEAHKLRYGYTLKHTIRYSSVRTTEEHSESVAEHVFGLIFLAHYFLKAEPSAASLDKAKVFSMLLYHDFPEIKYGDISTYSKTKEDEERENAAAQEVFASLPENLYNEGHALWQEYELHESPEAKFVYALDKIEPMFELLNPVTERSIKRLQITYDMHVHKKFPAVENFPAMRRFVEAMSKDMKERDVFWKPE